MPRFCLLSRAVVLRACCATLALAWAARPAQATLIDDFSSAGSLANPPSGFVILAAPSPPFGPSSYQATDFIPGVFAGARDVSASVSANQPPNLATLALAVTSGVLQFSSANQSVGSLTLSYQHGISDFSSAGAIEIDTQKNDLLPTTVQVRLTDTAGASSTSAPIAIPIAAAGTILVPLANFSGVDLASIHAISFTFNGSPDADFRLDSLSTQGPIVLLAHNPEPASLVIWSVLGLGAAMTRRRSVRTIGRTESSQMEVRNG
jgi:hypothetical protein